MFNRRVKWGITSLYHAIFCRSASSFQLESPERQPNAGRLGAQTRCRHGRRRNKRRPPPVADPLSTPRPPGVPSSPGRDAVCAICRVWCFPNVCLGSHQHQLRVERVQRSQGAVIVAGQRYGTGHGKVGDRNVCLAEPACQRLVKKTDQLMLSWGSSVRCHRRAPVPGAIVERASTLPPAPPQGITDQTPGTGETSPFARRSASRSASASAVHRGPPRQHWLS